MSIQTSVKGKFGKDNLLFVTVDSGKKVTYLLFDCGDCALFRLGKAVLQNIDHLFLSHLHIDHIAGFDSLFRHNYSRLNPLHIWGPQGTIDILHSRLKGFMWNLVDKSKGNIIIHDILEDKINSAIFYCKEKFAVSHPLDTEVLKNATIYQNDDFMINASILDHNTYCVAYALKEHDKVNIDIQAMKKADLIPGIWCGSLKNNLLTNDTIINTGEKTFTLISLRELLLKTTKGYKISYVTDIIMNKDNKNKLSQLIKDSNELIIESTYKESERELANKNYHLTVTDVALLAKESSIDKLTLFHVSDRYNKEDLKQMLHDALSIYPNTSFPENWKIN